MVSINKEIAQKAQNNDSEVVLSVNGVSKRFCRDLKKSLFYGVQDIASELIGLRGSSDKLRNKEFWALNDVSFELRRGEALGLVGKNGSGKSTLLRIIAGLIKPDAGTVEVNGRIAPLIALGAGFNPILTGRENIYANMSILGLSKEEIDERFDEVLEFAEIGDAIDAPVRSYSSGMAARLGFASAIHTEPDILLIDEVLAVGDIRFQAKCHRKLSELRSKGTAFILVSHNPQVILGVCDISVYISKGKWIMSGDTNLVMSQYEKDLFGTTEQESLGVINRLPDNNLTDSPLKIISINFKDSRDNILSQLNSGEKAFIEIKCKAQEVFNSLVVRINFYELKAGGHIIQFLSNLNDNVALPMEKGENSIVIDMPYVCFKPGLYSMKVIVRKDSLFTLDYIESFQFKVGSNGKMSSCDFFQPRSWQVVGY